MIATETIVPSTKLKIKLSTKRIEVDPDARCEFGQKASVIDGKDLCISKEKPSIPTSNKRGPSGVMEGQKEKRQKMDRKGTMQCAAVLKNLLSHPYSWVFSSPVDPVALNIPDYFTIISKPMDLGTIKSKLEKNLYSAVDDFAADVRLTFSNAMTYNPPNNDVHVMAKDLNKIFERGWNDLEKKSKWEVSKEGLCQVISGTNAEINRVRINVHKTMPSLKHKSLRRSHPSEELLAQSSSSTRDIKVSVVRSSEVSPKLLGKAPHEGCNRGSGPAKPCLSSDPGSFKGMSTEGPDGRNLHECGADIMELDFQPKSMTLLKIRNSRSDCDGFVSALEGADTNPCSPHTKPVDEAVCQEEWSTSFEDVQMSPKRALRAAILKSRFADTIIKAKQKTLLVNGDKADPVKIQQEKERLEKVQREERSRIEAQIRAAEEAARKKSEEESKQQRIRERELQRIALQKMEKTAEVEPNLESYKELEKLCGCNLSFGTKMVEPMSRNQLWNALEQIGLYMKDEYLGDEEDEEIVDGEGEEGEILSLQV